MAELAGPAQGKRHLSRRNETTKIRVLNCLLDNRLGGPQVRAYEVARKLRESDIETVFLFNIKQDGYAPVEGFRYSLLHNMQCLTRTSPLKNLALFLARFPFNVYRIHRALGSETIHLVHVNGLTNFLPALVGKLRGKKILWHLNDTMVPPLIRRLFMPLVVSLSDRILVAARNVGEYYFNGNQGPRNGYTVLYAPVNLDRYSPGSINTKKIASLCQEFGITSDDVLIGAIGNINRQKGYEYFIEAASQIKADVEKAKFLIVGARLETKQKYFGDLTKLIEKLNLTNDVIFTGFRSDIPEILSMMAMAMKVPIVATNVGGVSEQVVDGETGRVVEPRDPKALASAVLELLEKPRPEIETMVNKGRQRAERIFSLDRIAAQHRRLYQRLCSPNHRKR